MISIDVGIRNLSYVIFDTSFDENQKLTYQIKRDVDNRPFWDIIDITPDKYKYTCCYVKKTKKKDTSCSKPAICIQNELGYCASHKKFMKNDADVYNLDRNKMQIEEIFETLVQRLDELLEKCSNVVSIKQVIIEKQPPTNPRMKSIMASLQSYFIIRGRVDHVSNLYLDKVHLLDAKHKLSIYNGPEIQAVHLKKKYDQRKFLSKEYTKYYLKNEHQNEPDLYTHFESFGTKSDDLADCYLQARYYFEKVCGKKTIQQNNQITKYQEIDLKNVKKVHLFSDKKLEKTKTINLITLKHIIHTKNIKSKNDISQLSPHIQQLIYKTCEKYFGHIDLLRF